ncbi:MFS transporter [Chloroflexota bacterium]
MRLGELVRKPKDIFYGWWVIAASAVICSIGGGFYFYGFSTFFLPISADLGLKRAATSLVFSVARLEGALEGPIVGWLIDRFGARKLIAIGLVIFATGYISMHWMDSYLMFFILYAGVIALGYQTGFVHGKYALANKWFIRQRSKATGVISAAYGLGGAIIVPVLGWLIAQHGWRIAVVIAGATPLIIGLPLLLVIRSVPEEKELLPDGDEVETQEVEEVSFAVRDAVKTPVFWILSLGLTLRMFVVGGVWVHLVPMLVFKGFDEQGAANAIGLLLIVSIPVRFFFGWLGDIHPKRYLIALCCLIEATSLVVVLTAQSLWQVYLFVIIFALGYGVSPLNIAIVGEYFGRRYFATIRGIMGLVYAVGVIIGPIFAGYIYDVTQSYRVAFITFIVVYSLAAIILFFAKPPRLLAKEQFKQFPDSVTG